MPTRSHAAILAPLLLGLACPGCARDRGQITPTTSGTDLKAMPRGRMTPQPFPGSSLAAAGPRQPESDPAAMPASGDAPAR